MKDLLTVSGGKLELDEKNKRLILSLGKTKNDRFRKFVDQVVQAVKEHKAEQCLVDAINREDLDGASPDYAVQQFQYAMGEGLKRVAIVLPKRSYDQDVAHEFISKMGNHSVRGFTGRQEAEEWLNSISVQLRKAA